jgi:hypothetical protein
VRRIFVIALVALAALAGAVGSADAAPAPNSADRNIVWVGCDDVVGLSDAQLDAWQGRGVGGFVCMTRWLHGMGGVNDWSGDAEPPAGDAYALERRIRATHIVERMRARGMKAYLGFYATNYWNPDTPYASWTDDDAWGGTVLPTVERLAHGARALGFAGVAIDNELYPQDGGKATATWHWNHPGHASESTVRRAVRKRGRQLMHALLGGYPGVEVLEYDVMLPSSWGEVVQQRVNDIDFSNRVDVDFLNGMSSVDGYDAIRLADATFYKSPHFGSWDDALRRNLESLYAYMSRKLSNWDYASQHVYVSPFAWIDRGPCGCTWEEPRAPGYVADQLEAFRKWGMGGEFTTYAYQGLEDFDYSSYAPAMRAAARPAVVDTEPPRLVVDKDGRSGTVSDNMAVRSVSWRARGGQHGTARLVWHEGKGTTWSLPDDVRGRVMVSAEDVKGLGARRVARVQAKHR